jgi:1-phosphatidylinositol-4-phosphate 5-kinase
MKGSEFDREVLAKNKVNDLSKVTLKDIDFFKTEEKVWIEPGIAKCSPSYEF